MLAIRIVATAFFLFGATAHGAELRGHGGPVRAIAITADGQTAITGSFDAKAIIWSLETGEARDVLLFHDDQVDAVALLPDNRFASAGADGRIALWEDGNSTPVSVLEGHKAPVVSLALSPDGSSLASASWDGTVRLWPLDGGAPHILEGHQGNVNAVAFLSGGTLASAGHDATVILWPSEGDTAPVRVTVPTPLTVLAALAGDRLLAGSVDGTLRALDHTGAIRGEVAVFRGPLTALAVTDDGKYIAVAAVTGGIALLDAENLKTVHSFDTANIPVWSLAFRPGGGTLMTGGADRIVREWDVETGRRLGSTVADEADPMSDYAGNPDAQVYRACIACHTLDPDNVNRAGPTLHGIFGRRIASVPGYRYSEAFRKMDIVWTPETVAKLFELGPATYTPGTKMPEQIIGDPEDRAALIRFLQAEASEN
ncbi:c-type cytochrome [Mesorhizobium sp. CAU 1732]|uniref:c-type cytochrome n=1 Tax=Mesorhizobium sp. CAU 1732 TaxID=3140358 RepID=UPI00326140DF